MSPLWRKSLGGALAMKASGALWNCTTCPCTCSGDIIAAIRERQVAIARTATVPGATEVVTTSRDYNYSPTAAANIKFGTALTREFVISNAGATYDLTIQNNAGATVDTLGPGESGSYQTVSGTVTLDYEAGSYYLLRWLDASAYYQLPYCRARVNKIAPGYLDGLYTGGASAPPTLSATYADSAFTCSELETLVLDMVTSVKNAGTWVDRYTHDGDTFNAATEAAAKAGAISDYAQKTYITGPTPTPPFLAFKKSRLDYHDPLWDAWLVSQTAQLYLSNMNWTGPTKAYRIFAFCSAPTSSAFSKQGFTVPDEDEHGLMESIAASLDTQITATDWLGTPFGSPLWQEHDTDLFGFQLDDIHVLFDWTFTYT